jgi:hypothetical protein
MVAKIEGPKLSELLRKLSESRHSRPAATTDSRGDAGLEAGPLRNAGGHAVVAAATA